MEIIQTFHSIVVDNQQYVPSSQETDRWWGRVQLYTPLTWFYNHIHWTLNWSNSDHCHNMWSLLIYHLSWVRILFVWFDVNSRLIRGSENVLDSMIYILTTLVTRQRPPETDPTGTSNPTWLNWYIPFFCVIHNLRYSGTLFQLRIYLHAMSDYRVCIVCRKPKNGLGGMLRIGYPTKQA